MPKRTDLHKILVIGAGPIIIGQGCEFDYSGSQAVKALKEEGYEVVLVNSNPATIMTDPHLADATYVEPIEHETLATIIRKERPDALLPTLGGQTALNAALGLAKSGVLAECGVELIGARAEVIEKAESRELFREAMERIGLQVPASGIARSMDDVRRLGNVLPFPLIVRPGLHPGRHGRRRGLQSGGSGGSGRQRPDRQPHLRGHDRTERAGLERNRNGSHARRQGQLRHHLFH